MVHEFLIEMASLSAEHGHVASVAVGMSCLILSVEAKSSQTKDESPHQQASTTGPPGKQTNSIVSVVEGNQK